jgi:hypothetical protein
MKILEWLSYAGAGISKLFGGILLQAGKNVRIPLVPFIELRDLYQ